MDTSPEYIYELIEKLSWHVCWQGRDHRELRLDVANALRSLLQERDEYKRIVEAAEACDCRNQPIPADIAQKLGIKPVTKENSG